MPHGSKFSKILCVFRREGEAEGHRKGRYVSRIEWGGTSPVIDILLRFGRQRRVQGLGASHLLERLVDDTRLAFNAFWSTGLSGGPFIPLRPSARIVRHWFMIARWEFDAE